MKLFKLTNEEIINENEKFFKFYVYLPMIIAIVTAVFFFIWSIVDPAVFNYSIPKYYSDYYDDFVYQEVYGIMGVSSFFGAMIIWWLIGAVVTTLNYFVYKLVLTPVILHIYYLKSINSNSEDMLYIGSSKNPKPVTQSKVGFKAWICPNCGEKNSYAAKNCTNCFTPKP